ncbi:MAG: hypothetical protein U9O86_00130, partial [Campylobacterota bacterium]|nr:hypothetical protein [Campylobacterota bacterium]
MTETEALVKAQVQKYEKSDEEEWESEAQNKITFARELHDALSKDLYGQKEAVETVVNSMKNDLTENKAAPKATYLFLGSPATGKSYLAELMSEHIPKYKLMTFDMTQYHQQNGGELYGYPAGWKGYGVGQLTGFVHRNP